MLVNSYYLKNLLNKCIYYCLLFFFNLYNFDMDKNAIEKEISRLEDLMTDIVISKKTGFVMKNKAKLDKLRQLLKETK